MRRNEIDFPKEIAYAIVNISFGGKILGQKEVSYPLFINIANNEVLSVYKHENDYTAIKQVVLATPSSTNSQEYKVAFILLAGILVFFGFALNKDRKESENNWQEWVRNFLNPTTGDTAEVVIPTETETVFNQFEKQQTEI